MENNNSSPVVGILIAIVAIVAIVFVAFYALQTMQQEDGENPNPVIDVNLNPDSGQGSDAAPTN
jgi:uncharacterized protein YxeA